MSSKQVGIEPTFLGLVGSYPTSGPMSYPLDDCQRLPRIAAHQTNRTQLNYHKWGMCGKCQPSL
ncbi:MAG: hypothetical protein AMXMBFR16_11170 [Candidatus Uhrbacteria bacterium]